MHGSIHRDFTHLPLPVTELGIAWLSVWLSYGGDKWNQPQQQ
jgi:hypothetical protein